jgi:signal transduction histidine kinase
MNTAARKIVQSDADKARAMRVLVVDDDPIYRETSRMFLSMYGRAVTLAENGTAGIARASEADFDVMIVDLEMPDMTGLEVIAAVKKMPQHRDLPIIMVTSRDDAMAIDRAFELGASSFVVKPVNWTLLDHYVRFVRRAAENEIVARQAHLDAETVSRAKDNLLAVVRHEMKTPLSAILGFTKLAVEAQASGDVRALSEQLDFVRQSGERLLASFSDMAAYSDLISHKFEFQPERISAPWILGEVLDHRSHKVIGRGIGLVSREECRDCFIRADQTLLASALVRLVDNALIHARGATSIEIAVSDTGDGKIRFTVTDDGAGMSAENVARCLAPFSQNNMSLARTSEGLGLGLPIAIEIARLHGGALALHSEIDKGTRVEITLPKA